MNIERLTEIAEWLEAGGDDGKRKFDMFEWNDDRGCDTACCIGGYAAIMWADSTSSDISVGDALGLTREQANNLFYMQNTPLCFGSVTAGHAARVVRHLIKTGEVDWTV